jgi:SPP1 family predicted phage head-tail adaptor
MRARSGKLRRRIEIQEATETRDSHGGVIRSWSTVDTRWGSVEPLRGRELFEAQQVAPRVSVRVRMRHYPGLTTAHRLVITGDGA